MNRLTPSARAFLPAVILSATGAACLAAPVNDNFASATPLLAGVTASGTNVTATVQTGEPATHLTLTANATGTATGLSVWYSYTPTATGLASFSVVGTGTGTAAAAMQAAAYSGTTLTALTRIASASSIAGTATAPGTSFPSNLFEVHAGTPVFIQVTGNSATGTSTFDLTLTTSPRTGKVVLPRYSSWEWLHTIDGTDSTTAPTWAATWKNHSDATVYATGTTTSKFTLDAATPQRAPLGFAALDGAPGIATAIGTPTTIDAAHNNAAYFRSTFTLTADTSNLWAEVLTDDGAYIYIDDLPGIPVNIAAKLTAASTAAAPAFADYRPQAEAYATGALATGCRAYTPAGFNAERQTTTVFLGGLTGKLAAGSHKIAVSLHQTGPTSSDLAFDLQLIDMGAWPLSSRPASLTFNDTPWVAAAANAVPAAEYSHAPIPGQTDIAWACTSPALRGTLALNQAVVTSNAAAGSQKAFLLRLAEAQKFVTEPINVTGLSQFVASVRILSHDVSSGFEADDGFRVFLETSDDGVNFAEPATPLNIQVQINGPQAYTDFQDVWVTKSAQVQPNPYHFVRLVITGGVDSTNEYIFFDDIRFDQCQLFPEVTNVTYNNKGNDIRPDDTITFDLKVAGSGTTATTWTTSGFGAGNEISGTIGGAAVSITRPAADGNGAKLDAVFSVADDGNAACSSSVTVTTPAAAIGTITVSVPVRNKGANPSTTADDTLTYTLNVPGTATGATYDARSSEAGNGTLYGSGTYGADTTLTIPASVASVTIRDNSVTTLLKAVTVPPAGTEIAMGRTVLNGADRILYNNPSANTFLSAWKQTVDPPVTPLPADLGLTVTETTTTLSAGAVIVAAERGVLESVPVDVTGIAGVRVRATLRAWEDSTTSGFETADTFKLEVVETRAAGETVVNLLTGHPADANPANGMLNGYTTTAAAPYDTTPALDEFNAAGALVAGNSSGTFSFNYAVPADVLGIKVRASANNDSANEFFFLTNVVVTNSADTDGDADGLLDDWEIANFGNLDQNASGDPDGDGQSNAAEFAAGTLPASGGSFFGVTSSTSAAGLVSLTFNSVSGKKYAAQTSPDLTTWTNAGGTVTAAGASTTINGLPAGGPGRNYFRVKLVP